MIIAANFKTNLTRQKTAAYLKTLDAFISEHATTQEVMVFPPYTAFDTYTTKAVIGTQNAYATQNGAYTGEIGVEQLDEFGIKTILIGHSERRHVLGETQSSIAQKFEYFANLGFKIVYCIGEPLEVREEGNDALMAYLDDQLEGIALGYEQLVIAYEPVWAIGTGVTPTMHDIELIHTALKHKVNKPLLYGGSVKAETSKEILALENVDGVLVGSGALDVNDFISMLKDAQELDN